MSWSITAVGKATEVKEKFNKKADALKEQTYLGEAERTILEAHRGVVNTVCDAASRAGFDEKSVIAESSGHADSAGNSGSSLNVHTVYE